MADLFGLLVAFGLILRKNVHFPMAAWGGNKQGKVVVGFVVEGDGSLTDLRIIKGAGTDLDEEALRLIKLSPKWLPGMQNGRSVRVARSFPFDFSLSEK